MNIHVSHKSQQEQSLKYLRDQAISAHMNGDGILVNHLCSIAICQIRKWLKDKILEVSLKEFRWAIILALYWLVDDFMFHDIKSLIKEYEGINKAQNNLISCLISLIALVEQSLSDCVEEISNLKDNTDWIIDDSHTEDRVFLTFCIELSFVKKPEGPSWVGLADTWTKKIRSYSKTIKMLKTRLQFQANLLYPEANLFYENNLDGIELDGIEKDIFDTWEARLKCNWDDLDRLLDKLFKTVTFGSAEAVAVWHLHHNAHYKRKRDPEIVGLSRRRLITQLSDLQKEVL